MLNHNIRRMIFRKIERTLYRVVCIANGNSGCIDFVEWISPEYPDDIEKYRRSSNGRGVWERIVEELPMKKEDILVKSNPNEYGPRWTHIRLNNDKDIPRYIELNREIRKLERQISLLEQEKESLVDNSFNYNTIPYRCKYSRN